MYIYKVLYTLTTQGYLLVVHAPKTTNHSRRLCITALFIMRIDFCHSVSLWCNHSPFRGPLFLFSPFFHYAPLFLCLCHCLGYLPHCATPCVLQSNHQIQSGGHNTSTKRNPTILVVVASGGNVARSKLLFTGNRLEL